MGGGALSIVMDGHKPTLKWSAMTLDMSILVRFLMVTHSNLVHSPAPEMLHDMLHMADAVSDVWLECN